jgi:hypothetical protein
VTLWKALCLGAAFLVQWKGRRAWAGSPAFQASQHIAPWPSGPRARLEGWWFLVPARWCLVEDAWSLVQGCQCDSRQDLVTDCLSMADD